jgi:hypothetical protein
MPTSFSFWITGNRRYAGPSSKWASLIGILGGTEITGVDMRSLMTYDLLYKPDFKFRLIKSIQKSSIFYPPKKKPSFSCFSTQHAKESNHWYSKSACCSASDVEKVGNSR